ncbi:MAG: nitroreductase family protein [Anaerolineales bacterium]|nr:nitroreductase family protein [Anaerolineales bacterium]
MSEDNQFNQVDRYQALMDVVESRMTNRAFDPDYVVPQEHYQWILEAARHAPSGANAQPWHYIVVTDPEMKARLADTFLAEQNRRAKLGMKFPTPNYLGMKTAPGLIVVVADFRFVKAFPVLNDDSPLDQRYKINAERILLQSVAASVMSAHLAAAALGYAVWWVTAIGQEAIQAEYKPLLGVPDDLSVIDIMCFGPPLKPSYKRWKRELNEIMSWDRFDMGNYWTEDDIDEWIKTKRHRVMYRDAENVD